MRTQSVEYWVNKLGQNNPKIEPKDENENSYMQIAEYYISRQKEKTAA